VTPEPANIRDKNAVIVEAYIDNEWCRVGCIPSEKLRKTFVAIRNNEIQKVELKFIGFMFTPMCTNFKNWSLASYRCQLQIR